MCQSLAKSFVIFVFLSSLSANVFSSEVRTICSNNVTISAFIELKARDFRFWENFQLSNSGNYLFGLLHIKNSSVTKALFSTESVLLSIDGQKLQRAYKNTIASETIDHAGIWLEPNEEIEINVYWPTFLDRDAVAHSIVLSCDPIKTAGMTPNK
jgi:hypothetical protein